MVLKGLFSCISKTGKTIEKDEIYEPQEKEDLEEPPAKNWRSMDGFMGVVEFQNRQVIAKYIKREFNDVATTSYQRELSILQRDDRDPNLVEFLGNFDVLIRKNGWRKYHKILLEYCERKSLNKVLYKDKTVIYSMRTVFYWAEQLFSALLYFKKIGKTHRDIKPENVFVTKDFNLKLGDFGTARNLETLNERTGQGTPMYKAPERELYPHAEFTAQSDLYAMFLVLWEIIERRRFFTPEYGAGHSTIFFVDFMYNRNCVLIPPNCDHDIKFLIYNGVTQQPDDRPIAEEVHRIIGEMRRKYSIDHADLFEKPMINAESQFFYKPVGIDGTDRLNPVTRFEIAQFKTWKSLFYCQQANHIIEKQEIQDYHHHFLSDFQDANGYLKKFIPEFLDDTIDDYKQSLFISRAYTLFVDEEPMKLDYDWPQVQDFTLNKLRAHSQTMEALHVTALGKILPIYRDFLSKIDYETTVDGARFRNELENVPRASFYAKNGDLRLFLKLSFWKNSQNFAKSRILLSKNEKKFLTIDFSRIEILTQYREDQKGISLNNGEKLEQLVTVGLGYRNIQSLFDRRREKVVSQDLQLIQKTLGNEGRICLGYLFDLELKPSESPYMYVSELSYDALSDYDKSYTEVQQWLKDVWKQQEQKKPPNFKDKLVKINVFYFIQLKSTQKEQILVLESLISTKKPRKCLNLSTGQMEIREISYEDVDFEELALLNLQDLISMVREAIRKGGAKEMVNQTTAALESAPMYLELEEPQLPSALL